MSATKIDLGQNAGVSVGRSGKPGGRAEHKIPVVGQFQVEHWRDGVLLDIYSFKNGITNEGKNNLLDTHFDLGSQVTAWYMALVDNANFTALANDDTYDDIDQAGNGWDEFKSYTDAGNASSTTTRPVWAPDAASAQSISNSTQEVFDITGSGTVKGVAIVGAASGATATANTKGDHAADGVLWATALFDQGDTAVVNGDQLKITYTVSA